MNVVPLVYRARSLSLHAGTVPAASPRAVDHSEGSSRRVAISRLTPSGHERGLPLFHEWDLVDGLLVVLDGLVQWQVVEIE